MPFAFWAILTGVLSICGIPGFSGFFSKDEVIYGALEHGHPWLVRDRHRHGGLDGVLHVPPAVPHVLGTIAATSIRQLGMLVRRLPCRRTHPHVTAGLGDERFRLQF